MSATVSPPPNPSQTNPAPSGAPLAGEACPLCGAPLHPEQEWCLRCGAAARTRLAASPNWKTPIASVLVLLALSLGVLAAALVKLAGDTGPAKPASTTTVMSAAAPAPTTVTTAPQSLAPTTTVPPSVSTSTPTATTPGTRTQTGSTGGSGASATGKATTSTPTGSPTKPAGRLGLGKALEERIRKLAAERHGSGK